MKRLVFAAFGILLVGPLTPIAAEEISPERGEKIEKLYRRAGDLYQKKDHRGAAEAWEELLYLLLGGGDESEMRLRVHYMAALNYALLRKEKEAVAHLEKAIEHGLREPSSLERQSDFDAIRRSAGFAALPEKMRRKAEEDERRLLDRLRKFNFSLQALDGKTISKRDFLGQVLVVNIWGTWCGPCRVEIPHFVEAQNRYRAQGLRIVGLNSERGAAGGMARIVKRFIEDHGINYPCALVSQEVLKAIPEFRAFPTTLIFGRDGAPRAMQVGAINLSQLEAMVKPLLAEKAPGDSDH